jgi:hypothetical protein
MANSPHPRASDDAVESQVGKFSAPFSFFFGYDGWRLALISALSPRLLQEKLRALLFSRIAVAPTKKSQARLADTGDRR